MTGPTVASSPTRQGPGGATGGGLLSIRTRPVTRSSAPMSSGRSTRQQQRRQGANTGSPSTPSDDQPATPAKAGPSSSPETRSFGAGGASVSTTTPPWTASSITDEASRESPTPTPSSAGGDHSSSSQYHRHHSYPPRTTTTQQQQQPSASGTSRKRSAATAIEIDTTDNPRIDRLSLNTPITAGTGSSDPSPTSFRGSGGGGGAAGPELICLCTPAPKVPRPRNAFILYRQHHQQQTVAANPGTANPEISKIIGNQWKREPEERKAQWKRLAEEEKLRHQQQYPDYKYQPRRSKSGKAGRSDSGSQTPLSATFPSGVGGGGGGDPGICPKCHGRYIATPRTPSTPFPSAARLSGGVAAAMPPAGGGSSSAPWDASPPEPSRLPRKSMGGPADFYRRHPYPGPPAGGTVSSPYPHQYPAQQGFPYPDNRDRERMGSRSWPAGGGYDQPPPPHQFRDRLYDIREDYDAAAPVAGSPSDAKRRRFNEDYCQRQEHQQALPSPPIGYTQHHAYPPPPQPMQLQPPHPRTLRQSSIGGIPPPATTLPGPGMVAHRPTPTMGPPPPPRSGTSSSTAPTYHNPPARGRTASHSEFDQSLRLPPLKTHLPPRSEACPIAQTSSRASSTSPMEISSSSGNSKPNNNVPMSGGLNISYGGNNNPTNPVVTGPPPSSDTTRAPQPAPSSSTPTPQTAIQTQPPRQCKPREKSALEPMIMSMHYMNKLAVLDRIINPLPPVSLIQARPETGQAPVRGPIIAIEGPNPRLMKQVALAVMKALDASGVCEVRKWVADGVVFGDGEGEREGEDVDMLDAGGRFASQTPTLTPAGGSGGGVGGSHGGGSRAGSIGSVNAAGTGASAVGNPLTAYWEEMTKWHGRSVEIVKSVTGEGVGGPGDKGKGRMSISEGSGSVTSSGSQEGSGAQQRGEKLLPVALLPAGYCLTLSDQSACNVPITDAYAPVDHWQWMASMWRGVVAPDLIIYVQDDGAPEFMGEGYEFEGPGGGAGRQVPLQQSVEFKRTGLRVALMVVRLSEGGGGLLEKTERRLGFEVMEWVRSGLFSRGGEGV